MEMETSKVLDKTGLNGPMTKQEGTGVHEKGENTSTFYKCVDKSPLIRQLFVFKSGTSKKLD